LPVHLKVDTGMSRLGVLPGDLPALLDWFEGDEGQYLRLEGLMTHFACADELDDPVSGGQLELFRASVATLASRGLHPPLRHVCNSAGLVRLPQAHFDMVRPGIALYGAAAEPCGRAGGAAHGDERALADPRHPRAAGRGPRVLRPPHGARP
jgi:alanine racemase